MGALCAHFSIFGKDSMNQKVRLMAQAAMLAALYAVLSHLQNLLLPGSASMPIQLRIAEALCILAFFTPAAIQGLTLGCMLFNLTSANPLPLDFLVGSLATFLSVSAMRAMKKWPFPAIFLPAIFNGLLIGWELSIHIGGGFWLNAAYVAAGEALVMLLLGLPLLLTFKARNLQERLF